MNLLGNKLKIRELASLAFLILLIIGIPLGVSLVQKQQVLKGKATSNFNVGFNIPGIVHYGYGDLLPYSSMGNTDADLSQMHQMGARILRVFVANNRVGHEETARRLDTFLNKASGYGIFVIPSLINYYGDTGYNPQGTDGFYTDNWNGIPLLGQEFFDGGYKGEYENFVRTVVSYNKDHPNIYAWEPGNELKNSNSPGTFINFMSDITSIIKSIDPNHAVATGMINAAHSGLTPDAIYPYLPAVDIITIHSYEDRNGIEDVNWALSNGKGIINEEIGIGGTGDRSDRMRDGLEFWKNSGVSAALQWGFIAKGYGDNGGGDSNFGMDTIWHSDYDQYFALFSSYNGGPSDAPTPTPGSSCTIGNQSPSLEDACESCIKTQRPTLPNDIRNLNSGLFSGCADKAVLNYWCNGGISQEARDSCSNLKNNTCASSCGGSSPTNTPVPTNSPNPTATPLPTQGPTSVPTPTRTLTPGPTSIPTITPFPTVPLLITPTTSTTKPTTNPTPTPTPSGKSGTTPTTSPLSKALPTLRPDKVKYDYNIDLKINSIDVSMFIGGWIKNDKDSITKFDSSNDGVINTLDYSLLVKNLDR